MALSPISSSSQSLTLSGAVNPAKFSPLGEAGPCSVKAGAKPSHAHPHRAASETRLNKPAQVLADVQAAQKRLDGILKLASSGRSFTPAELIALQANVYQASQQIDLGGKVLDKIASGFKQILQTQV